MWKGSKTRWVANPYKSEMHAWILPLSSHGNMFLGINLSCKLMALISSLRIDIRLRFISIKALVCMCPDSLYLLPTLNRRRSRYRPIEYSFKF